MWEIYWLQRLDGIHSFLVTMIFFLIIMSAASLLFWIIAIQNKECLNICECCTKKRKCVEERGRFKIGKKIFPWSFAALVLAVLLKIFTPTTKEAYVILGVGGTIDYLKTNETVKQLPDKCIYALDKWVDELTPTEKEEE